MKAEDILWNFDRHLNEKAPHFDRAQALTYRPYTSQVKHYEKIDDTHMSRSTPKRRSACCPTCCRASSSSARRSTPRSATGWTSRNRRPEPDLSS